KGLAPVALARKQPVAQLVIYRFAAGALLFQPVNNLLLGFIHIQSVQECTVDGFALSGIGLSLKIFRRLYGSYNRKIKFLGKLPVTFILTRNGHNSARPIGC